MNVLEEAEKLMVMQLRFGEKINGISVVNELLDYIDDDTIKSNDSKVWVYKKSASDDCGRKEKRTYYSTDDVACIFDEEFKIVKTIGCYMALSPHI